jgi:hypothetical protein
LFGEVNVIMTDDVGPDLAAPPRRVSMPARAVIFLGGRMSMFGWVLLGLSMIFGWELIGKVHLAQRQFGGEMSIADGVVTGSKRAGRHSQGAPVYANHYVFTGPDGKEYDGVSYAAGTRLEEGRSVKIEYAADNPAASRIEGMRHDTQGFPVFVVIFPLAGFVCIVAGAVRARKDYHLLVNGEVGVGKLKSKKRTNVFVNRRQVVNLVFQFTAKNGKSYFVSTKTNQPGKLQDQEYEGLLYDPRRPSRAVMVHSLPGMPKVDAMGNVRIGSSLQAVPSLLVPAAVIVENVVFALAIFIV